MITGFDIVRAIALGADACYSARAMMLALGCIQALICNTNKCPAGIATQDPDLAGGIDIGNKGQRVANYQSETINSVREIIASAGYSHPNFLRRTDIYRRITPTQVASYEEIFPSYKGNKVTDGAGHEL